MQGVHNSEDTLRSLAALVQNAYSKQPVEGAKECPAKMVFLSPRVRIGLLLWLKDASKACARLCLGSPFALRSPRTVARHEETAEARASVELPCDALAAEMLDHGNNCERCAAHEERDQLATKGVEVGQHVSDHGCGNSTRSPSARKRSDTTGRE